MANFQLAPKLTIFNSKEMLSVLFFALAANGYALAEATADNPATTTVNEDNENYDPVLTGAAAADMMKIEGIGQFKKEDVRGVLATRAIGGQKQTVTVTLSTTGLVAGKEFIVHVKQISSNLPAEWAQYNAEEYAHEKRYQIITQAGDTSATIATRLLADILADDFDVNEQRMFTVSRANSVLTLVSKVESVELKVWIEAVDPVTAGMVKADVAQTVAAFPGRGTYEQLKEWRLETGSNSGPYATNDVEQPEKGARYTQILIQSLIEREDLFGSSTPNDGPIKGVHSWQLYIKETLTDEITAILTFLNANAAKKSYYASRTPDAAVAKETPSTDLAAFLAA